MVSVVNKNVTRTSLSWRQFAIIDNDSFYENRDNVSIAVQNQHKGSWSEFVRCASDNHESQAMCLDKMLCSLMLTQQIWYPKYRQTLVGFK